MTTIKITDTFLASDRAVAYGDGFFTTAKIVQGRVDLWELHCERLTQCASRLGFPLISLNTLSEHIADQIGKIEIGVLKIIISRGVGGRGYAVPEQQQPLVAIQVMPFPEHYSALKQQGIELDHVDVKLAKQPLLAGLKTLNRLEQVLIKQEMQARAISEALVCDTDNNVIETSVANLVFVKNNKLYTPALAESGIHGVYLKSLQQTHDVDFISVKPEELAQFDAVFCCNSLMGLIPVTRIGAEYFALQRAQELMATLSIS